MPDITMYDNLIDADSKHSDVKRNFEQADAGSAFADSRFLDCAVANYNFKLNSITLADLISDFASSLYSVILPF